jgi:hypothetical protein
MDAQILGKANVSIRSMRVLNGDSGLGSFVNLISLRLQHVSTDRIGFTWPRVGGRARHHKKATVRLFPLSRAAKGVVEDSEKLWAWFACGPFGSDGHGRVDKLLGTLSR